MEKLNQPNFVADIGISKGTIRKIEWPVLVVFIAAISSIAWSYALLRVVISIVSFATT